MNDQSPTPDLSHLKLSDAALIRIAADGEQDLLSHEQRARLDELQAAGNPGSSEVTAQIEAEQSLRSAFARAHADAPVPAGLRERLQARLSSDLSAESAPSSIPEQLASKTSDQSFWRRSLATLAVAAAIAIGAFSFFQGGTPGSNGTITAGLGGQAAIIAAREAAAKYVAAEHGRCVMDLNRALSKSRVVEAQDLPQAVQTVLDQSANLEDLIFSGSPGVEFNWAGPCGVPGPASMHLSFKSPEHGGDVSLFIQPTRQDLGLEDDVTYTFGSAADGEGAAVYVWARRGFVYYLVASEAPGCDTLLKGQDAPVTMIKLTQTPSPEVATTEGN